MGRISKSYFFRVLINEKLNQKIQEILFFGKKITTIHCKLRIQNYWNYSSVKKLNLTIII